MKLKKNTTRKMLTSAVALISVMALVGAACNHSDDSSTSTSAGSATTTAGTTATTASAGLANAPGFDGTTISLGFLTSLTGPLAVIGGPIRDGAQIYWDYVNEELGGIAGQYRVELIVEDTKDDTAETVRVYQKIKNDIVFFAEVLSTPPTAAVLPLLKQDGIMAIPGSLAARWVREPNLLPQAAPYEYEIINIVDWWHTQRSDGTDVYCSVHVDDAYGTSTLAGLTHIADQLNIDVVEQVTIDRGDTEFTAQITSLQDAGCTVVVAITVPTEQNTMLGEALTAGFEPTWLGALPAYLSLYGGVAPLAPRYENFYFTQDAPSVLDTSVPGIVNFNARREAYQESDFSTFNLAGYFLSFGAHALLEKAVELGDLSREGILAASEALGEVDVEGLAAANFVYGPAGSRVPPKASRIFEHQLNEDDSNSDHISEVAAYTSSHIDSFVLPTP